MTEKPKNPGSSEERLERLLRVWGAEQAVSEEESSLGRSPAPVAMVTPRLLRWSLLAAAASVVFCTAGAIFFLTTPARQPAQQAASPAPALPTTRPADAMASQLAEANRKLSADLAAMRQDHEAEKANVELRLVQLQRELAFTVASRKEAMQLAVQATTQVDELATLTRTLQQRIDALTVAERTAVAQLDARKVVIDRLEESLRAQRTAMIAQFQSVYLPGGGTMTARQQAIKRNRLTERAADVRKLARDEDATKTIEQLEVWLTRIELLDPANASAARTLAGQAPGAKLVGQIEQALLAKRQPREVETWLLECELVLLNIEGTG
ncbi:MAG: hypothetical protein PHU85_14205 [Phycisphaerae bacterium]|nr:hypothetical protein [Phycisphaerae bacterium]